MKIVKNASKNLKETRIKPTNKPRLCEVFVWCTLSDLMII